LDYLKGLFLGRITPASTVARRNDRFAAHAFPRHLLHADVSPSSFFLQGLKAWVVDERVARRASVANPREVDSIFRNHSEIRGQWHVELGELALRSDRFSS